LPKDNKKAQKFFCDYQQPYPLLPLNYFENKLFNRYVISFEKESIDVETLKDRILSEEKSSLVILNTIDDTKELYKLLSESIDNDEILLLNTHFTPRHRKIKIYLAKHWQVLGPLQMEEEALTPSRLGWVQMWERLIRFLRKAPLVTQVL